MREDARRFFFQAPFDNPLVIAFQNPSTSEVHMEVPVGILFHSIAFVRLVMKIMMVFLPVEAGLIRLVKRLVMIDLLELLMSILELLVIKLVVAKLSLFCFRKLRVALAH